MQQYLAKTRNQLHASEVLRSSDAGQTSSLRTPQSTARWSSGQLSQVSLGQTLAVGRALAPASQCVAPARSTRRLRSRRSLASRNSTQVRVDRNFSFNVAVAVATVQRKLTQKVGLASQLNDNDFTATHVHSHSRTVSSTEQHRHRLATTLQRDNKRA